MYAAGTSKDAVEFNCTLPHATNSSSLALTRAVGIQRGHQQALETFPMFLILSLIGGLRHPLLTAAAGVAFILGRKQWAASYASDGPAGRYNGQWTRFIWYSLSALPDAPRSYPGFCS